MQNKGTVFNNNVLKAKYAANVISFKWNRTTSRALKIVIVVVHIVNRSPKYRVCYSVLFGHGWWLLSPKYTYFQTRFPSQFAFIV